MANSFSTPASLGSVSSALSILTVSLRIILHNLHETIKNAIQQSGPIAEQEKILYINTGLLIKLYYKLSNFISKPQQNLPFWPAVIVIIPV